jgi:hypothetical protein
MLPSLAYIFFTYIKTLFIYFLTRICEMKKAFCLLIFLFINSFAQKWTKNKKKLFQFRLKFSNERKISTDWLIWTFYTLLIELLKVNVNYLSDCDFFIRTVWKLTQDWRDLKLCKDFYSDLWENSERKALAVSKKKILFSFFPRLKISTEKIKPHAS